MNEVWKPQPRQAEFMARKEYEALYGGAAGGGKSDALLAEALRQVDVPHYRGLILRKTFPQTAELVDRSRAIYKPAFPNACYTAGDHCWTFPSGAKIMFGSMQRTGDMTHYQGHCYDYIAFDELTHFTYAEYTYMFSRNRPSGPNTRVYMRAATNPGGVGHDWVKRRFITPAKPLSTIVEEFKLVGGQSVVRDRVFVPSTVLDNAALLANDPSYIAKLAMLPEAQKQALLYGSWDSFDGQVFSEWRDDASHYDDMLYTHVINPFAIPSHWRIYRGFDFGYTRPYAVGWYAADEERRLYRIAEYYGCTGEANVGVRQHPAEIACRIREMETNHPLLAGKHIIGVADPSIFSSSGSESVAELMARPPNYIYFSKGDNARIAGKMQLHYRLAFDGDGRSMFYCFNTCRHFMRTIPALTYDAATVEDVDTRGEDHIYDECRYVLMENPVTPTPRAARLSEGGGPLDVRASGEDKYRFYRV